MKLWKPITLAVLVLALAAVIALISQKGVLPQHLPDGSVLSFGEVKYGRTNNFILGNPLQRLLSTLVPTNRVSVLGIKSRRFPDVTGWHADGECLDFLVHLTGYTNSLNNLNGDWQSNVRVVLWGEDNQEYNTYAPHFSAYGSRSNQCAGLVQAHVFAREARRVNVRFERRNGKDWQRFAQFSFKNPAPLKRAAWEPEVLPNAKKVGDFDLTLKEVEVVPQLLPHNNQSTLGTKCFFRLSYAGENLPTWMINKLLLRDCTGNWEESTSFSYTGTNFRGSRDDWQDYMVWHILDPKSVWKLEVNFSAGTSNDEYTVFLPLPAPSLIRTNFDGASIDISLKNKFLTIQMLNRKTEMRLCLFGVKDEHGREIKDEGGGSYGMHFYSRRLDLSGVTNSIAIKLGVHRIYHTEFLFKPRFRESFKGPIRVQ